MKPKPWRVRVKRELEDWVEVVAEDGFIAEHLAAQRPGVIHVFGNSAIPGDVLASKQLPAIHVEDDREER